MTEEEEIHKATTILLMNTFIKLREVDKVTALNMISEECYINATEQELKEWEVLKNELLKTKN